MDRIIELDVADLLMSVLVFCLVVFHYSYHFLSNIWVVEGRNLGNFGQGDALVMISADKF